MIKTRYNSFEIFMSDVLTRAQSIVDIKTIFEINDNIVIEIIKEILKYGWKTFSGLALVLILGIVQDLGNYGEINK